MQLTQRTVRGQQRRRCAREAGARTTLGWARRRSQHARRTRDQRGRREPRVRQAQAQWGQSRHRPAAVQSQLRVRPGRERTVSDGLAVGRMQAAGLAGGRRRESMVVWRRAGGGAVNRSTKRSMPVVAGRLTTMTRPANRSARQSAELQEALTREM